MSEHETEELARVEANRLARECPGRTYHVVSLLATYLTPITPIKVDDFPDLLFGDGDLVVEHGRLMQLPRKKER